MQKKITDIGNLLDQGEVSRARHMLVRAASKTVAPRYRLPLARLARRAMLPKLGLRLLAPHVRPRPKQPAEATPEEKAEYSASLLMTGAYWEAGRILATVDARLCPDKLLFQAYGHIFRWEYRESIALLEAYLASSGLTPRQVVLGKINLLAAMVHERWRPALTILRDELLGSSSNPRFLGNVLELAAQDAIFHREWAPAEQFLTQAERLLKKAGGLDRFFVRKWRGILTSKRDGDWKPLGRARKEAYRMRHWESMRDCDLYLATGRRDEKTLVKVYLGTPFESYRQRLFLEWGRPVEIPDPYLWGSPREILDLRTGAWRDKPLFRPGSISLRLLTLLSSDFYRPFGVGALYSALYPGEFFNPQTSAAKVYEGIRRLKRELAAHGVEVRVAGSADGYRLVLGAGVGIRIHRGEEATSSESSRLKALQELVRDEDFTNRQASRLLRLPARTTSRMLKGGCEKGLLEKRGAGATTSYRFVA